MSNSEIKNAKKWLVGLLVTVLVFLALLGSAAYFIDPFFAYRARDNTYMTSATFSTSGLVKNHLYDTAVIGSSMIWDLDMSSFRDKLGVEPLKVTIGGMSLKEIKGMVDLLSKTGKAERYFVNLDLNSFTVSETEGKMLYPDYLMDDNALNDYRYLLGFEAWMRFIPVDLAFLLFEHSPIKLPEDFANTRNIDNLGKSRTVFQYGKEIVIGKRVSHKVSEVDTKDLYQRMKNHVDSFFDGINFSESEYVFFFPPYSALYWYDAKINHYYQDYMDIKQYIVDKLAKYKNIKMYDFQSADLISDLDNYKDTTHYSPDVSEWTIQCFADDAYQIDAASVSAGIKKLDYLVERFIEENSEWLSPLEVVDSGV